jgi:hypothetical protein
MDVCDGVNDCFDFTDELNCPGKPLILIFEFCAVLIFVSLILCCALFI